MNMKMAIVLTVIVVMLMALIWWQWYAYNTPEPAYRIIKSDNKIEIREYPELIVAEVNVKGERYQSINDGFRLLANYIFGNNKSNQTIAMTAPVQQQEIKEGWVVRFIMPPEFTLSSLPQPNNHAVSFSLIKSKKYIVIRFSGFNSDNNIQSHTKMLLNYIQKNNLKTIGEPIMAFYNPPWILPFLRRNEIIIELQ
jgi:effector-binding domain-containing protein